MAYAFFGCAHTRYTNRQELKFAEISSWYWYMKIVLFHLFCMNYTWQLCLNSKLRRINSMQLLLQCLTSQWSMYFTVSDQSYMPRPLMYSRIIRGSAIISIQLRKLYWKRRFTRWKLSLLCSSRGSVRSGWWNTGSFSSVFQTWC